MIARILTIAALLTVGACAVSTDYDPYVAAVGSQLEKRSYQTRRFEQADYRQLVTAVIGTLQDYHFRIVDIDPELGVITAYQLTSYEQQHRYVRRTDLTVLIRERGDGLYSLRVNISKGLETETGAELYQQFFSALDRKLHYQTRA